MFLVCWHYCTSFLTFLLLAIGPIIFIVGAFMLKRGIIRYRKPLRKRALIIWLISFIKMIFLDYRIFAQKLFCAHEICSKVPNTLINVSAIALMGIALVIWLRLYQKFVPDKATAPSPSMNILSLKRWTKYSTIAVIIFVLWVAGPFLTSLAINTIPSVFLILSWHYFAILGCVCLMVAFWRLEEFQMHYSSTKSRLSEKKDVWVPKDTLWTLAFIYVFTAFLAFASSHMLEGARDIIIH